MKIVDIKKRIFFGTFIFEDLMTIVLFCFINFKTSPHKSLL